MQMNNVQRSAPLTHDLCKSLIVGLGGELRRVQITRVEKSTYFAELHIVRGGEVVHVDARPSDSIAIALRFAAPIFADESLLVGDDRGRGARRRRRSGNAAGAEHRGHDGRAAQGVPVEPASRRLREVQSLNERKSAERKAHRRLFRPSGLWPLRSGFAQRRHRDRCRPRPAPGVAGEDTHGLRSRYARQRRLAAAGQRADGGAAPHLRRLVGPGRFGAHIGRRCRIDSDTGSKGRGRCTSCRRATPASRISRRRCASRGGEPGRDVACTTPRRPRFR